MKIPSEVSAQLSSKKWLLADFSQVETAGGKMLSGSRHKSKFSFFTFRTSKGSEQLLTVNLDQVE
jgi:hypothetical protein